MTNLEKLIADNQWRPIEEAPRGVLIDVWIPATAYNDAHRLTDVQMAQDESCWFDWSGCAVLDIFPTHFRPLHDDRLAKCAELLINAIWRVVDNVPLTLEEAQECLNETLTECEKIAGGE